MNPLTAKYFREYGEWIHNNSRADGMVLDPRQASLFRWLSPEYIDPNEFTFGQFLLYLGDQDEQLMMSGCSACALSSARQVAAKLGSELVKEFKTSGVGQAAGRSGGHGAAFRKAGAELIRRANSVADKELREAMKIEGQRLLERARGISHK